MYIKINLNPYFGNSNFHEILSVSGEKLTGTDIIKVLEGHIEVPFDNIKAVYFDDGLNMIKYKNVAMLNQEKIVIFKLIRQQRLQNMMQPIKTYRAFEDDMKALNSTYSRTLTDTLYTSWLSFVDAEMKRIDTVDWSVIEFSEINPNNKTLFPDPPAYPDDIL